MMPQKDASRERQDASGADKNRTAGAGQVSTSDPLVDRGDERLAQRPPEQAVSFETNQRGTVSTGLADPKGGLAGPPAAPDRESQSESDRHQRDARQDHGRPKKREQHQPQPPAVGMNWKSLAITGLLALVCGVAGAWGYSALVGAPKSDDQARSQKKGAEKSSAKNQNGKPTSASGKGGDDSASASQIVGFTSADDADALKKQLRHLDDRIDRLSQRLDRVTRPENKTPPVLHTLQTHLNDLAREMDEVAGLPSRLERLEQQCNSLQEQLKTVRAQRSETPESSGGALSVDPDVPPPAPPSTAEIDPTLELAIGLFEEGQYSQARRVLQRLQRTHPKDARVWYFSALATALGSGTWEGEAEKLAEKGAACERSGMPSRAEIDAAMGILTPRTGEAWLARRRGDAHHRQAKK